MVYNYILHINNYLYEFSKALGPGELHPRILKELANEQGAVLSHLYQQSLDTGEIPKEWLLAKICPL